MARCSMALDDVYAKSISQALVQIISTADKPEVAYEQKTLIDLIASVITESASSVEEVVKVLRVGVDPSAADFLEAVYKTKKRSKLMRRLPEVYFASPLYHTATEDYPNLTDLLLAYDANPNSWNRVYVNWWSSPTFESDQPVWMTPAHGAVYFGSERCLQTLIQYGADVNARIQAIDGAITEELEVGYTPLHIAARGNVLKCVKLLLDNGADPCATDAKGQTSLYLAAKHGNPDIVMALLNCDAGNASVSIPTPEKDTALHECFRKVRMKECIKELVRRGADVGFHNMDHESPVDLAVKYRWSKDIIELLIMQGHGMDFDRQHPTVCSPLERVMLRPSPERPGTLLVRQKNKSGSHREWVDSLALLFLQMGVSRDRLNSMLWYELHREEPGNHLLDTLMDSFAYLPSLSHLEHSVSTSCSGHDHERDDDCTCFSVPPWLLSYAQSNHRCKRAQKLFMASLLLKRSGLPTDNVSVRYVSRRRTASESHVRQKKEDYCRRQKEIPTLAHLCRSTIRRTLKADVRQVISLPIPTTIKEYILLGYKLTSQGQKDGEKESVPSSSSSESGQPELSTS